MSVRGGIKKHCTNLVSFGFGPSFSLYQLLGPPVLSDSLKEPHFQQILKIKE